MFEVVSLLTGRIKSTSRELAVSAAVYGLVAVLALTAYVALLYAMGLLISAEAGPLIAALSIAGLTIGLALIALLVLHLRRKRLQRLRELRTRSTVAAGTSAAMAAVVPAMVRASPLGSLLAVAVLTYVAARAGERDRRKA